MQIRISTTQELRFVMSIDAHCKSNSSSSSVSLFFVDGTAVETPTATFDEAIRTLSEAGLYLVAEVAQINPLKAKRKGRRSEKKKS